MLDFCLSFPYALLLMAGGVAAFITKKSLPSLIMGTGSAATIALMAAHSYRHFKETRTQSGATAGLSLGISVAITVVMIKRYLSTGKVMPAGAVGALSVFMDVFYLWCLTRVGRPAMPKNENDKAAKKER
mmetsp:Transcript_9363/g.21203  ORF Transcript_9363/g.21203 Transcript_9363/m.21203 type:complete len:130 (+) Transcript_9363:171-560(+)